jgi:hypothetical protein
VAKNMLPMKAGGGVLGKLVGAVVVLAVLALVVGHPADAATWVTGVIHLLGRVIGGTSTFLRDVLG